MNTMYKWSAGFLMLILVSCGAAVNDKGLEKKKATLEKLKAEQQSLTEQIATLEKEISKLDTSAAKAEKPKLVSLSTLGTGQFTHYIDLKGRIEAENVAYVTPRGQGGMVKAIYVKQGDPVRKGQLLMKLDDPLTGKQIEQVKVQLDLAQTLYQRRKNLWDQNIGTQMDLLQAKNNVENLEKQIKTLEEQLSLTNVYAEMSGVADWVTIKVGETFAPASASTVGIRIVNTSDLKVVTDVPENYLGKVREGSNLLITLPESGNDSIRARVSVAGKTIDQNNRTFYIEAKIPAGKGLRPNQLAMVRIQDYATGTAITVPVSTLQSDENGKFVMVAAKEKEKTVARKRTVTVGEMYNERLEIRTGLQAGDVLITEGFQGLYDGQLITTEVK